MSIKVRIYSNSWRLAQVVGLALSVAALLLGATKWAEWRNSREAAASVVEPDSNVLTQSIQMDSYIEGHAVVVDGDTLAVSGMQLRLEGIDAPELAQSCEVGDELWPCGEAAANALGEWIAGRRISCIKKGVDRYQRTLARCFVDGADMQSWIVSKGWALAYIKYSSDYVDAEGVARVNAAGIWRGRFLAPWVWRNSSH